MFLKKVSVDKKIGLLILCDTYSDFTQCFPFSRKTEIFNTLEGIINSLDRRFPNQVQHFKSDNSSEFTLKKVTDFLKAKGIQAKYSLPYVHEQNGKIESNNERILMAILCLLFASNLDLGHWSFAARQAVFAHNVNRSFKKKSTPHQMVHGKVPDVSNLRVFGPMPLHFWIKTSARIYYMLHQKSSSFYLRSKITKSIQCAVKRTEEFSFLVESPQMKKGQLKENTSDVQRCETSGLLKRKM